MTRRRPRPPWLWFCAPCADASGLRPAPMLSSGPMVRPCERCGQRAEVMPLVAEGARAEGART